MKKRILSLFLMIALVLSFSVTAFAADISTDEVDLTAARIELLTEQKLSSLGVKLGVDKVKTVNDFNGNEYALVECVPKGYFIYHIDSGICVEYNLNAQSPFINVTGEALYGGPTYYYEKNSGVYTHTVLDSTLEAAALADMTKQCRAWNTELLACKDVATANYIQGKSNTVPVLASAANTDYWVTSKSFFTSATSNFGYKIGGYCGYIAANLILKYWDNRGTIDLPYYSSHTGLTNALIAIGEDDYDSSTWAANISSIINTYCENNSLPEEASWAVGVSGITSEIGTNKRPVILFGNLEEHNGGNHAIVVYGYNSYENPGYYTFRCHFGWNSDSDNDYTDVHVSGASGSIFGSNTKYKP